MIDLSNPVHREALLEAAAMRRDDPDLADRMMCVAQAVVSGGAKPIPFFATTLALSSPTESAALVRALLEGCGLDVCDYGCDHADVRVYLVSVYGEEGTKIGDRVGCWIVGDTYPLRNPDVPSLILCLLACTTREEALAALREA